jgi:hypothetical protein
MNAMYLEHFVILFLFKNQDSKYQTQQKWELLETITGSYGPEMVQNDMVEIKFMRSIRIKVKHDSNDTAQNNKNK